MPTTATGEKFDATHPQPRTARGVFFRGERYSREGLETAWLLIQEHNGAPIQVRASAALYMHKDGWTYEQAVAYVDAAMSWTGNVVQEA